MSDELRQVGFFRELDAGAEDGPSLREAVRVAAAPDEQLMVAYLRAGAVLAATGQLVSDVLAVGGPTIAALEIHTDGEWVWPADLAYYLSTYHVELPAELWTHVTANDWEPPVMSDADLSEAEARLTSGR